MPILYRDTTFQDIYGNNYAKYTANAGDYVKARIDFSTSVTILTSQTQQITFSALTGEVKISEGSWYDEGFRVGDTIGFAEYNQNNNPSYNALLVILAMPTDKIIVVSGLPQMNNATPPDKHIWQFWVNKLKEELELSVNWIDNSNTSAIPSMESLIDGESQRFTLTNLQSLPITNGAGSGTLITQVGKRSGSFGLSNTVIYRYNDDTYGTALRQNYSIFIVMYDIGVLFPTNYAGPNCLKFISKISLKQKIGDTKSQDLYYSDPANTGYFNEGFNSNISNVIAFPSIAPTISYNIDTEIPFSLTINTTAINTMEIGCCYSTLDDTYNENQFDAQDKFLKLLKSGLINTSSVGAIYTSSSFGNDYYQISLDQLSITTSGSTKTFAGILTFKPRYTSVNSFGKFIETRGDQDRNLKLWLKVGNTNCVLFDGQMTFEMPVGKEIFPSMVHIVNHDDNTIHDDMLVTGFTDAVDINIEDDLGYFADVWLNTADVNTFFQVEIICAISGSEFSLEKMVFDISTQDFTNWIPMVQNVSNNLPTSSAKKQAYLKKKGTHSLGIIVRIYYPFLIRWEYWLKQLNASSYFVANGKNNKNWLNYENIPTSKLWVKIGVGRNGVMDRDLYPLNPFTYDWNTNVNSVIELIDNDTLQVVEVIVIGKIYTIKATHTKIVGNWDAYPYGQITIEPKESAPRFMISTEIDADVSALNPLSGNSAKRLDVQIPSPNIIIYTCTFDTNKVNGKEYCITSKISDQGAQNNPTFENKITEDNIDKITEDLIIKIIE